MKYIIEQMMRKEGDWFTRIEFIHIIGYTDYIYINGKREVVKEFIFKYCQN